MYVTVHIGILAKILFHVSTRLKYFDTLIKIYKVGFRQDILNSFLNIPGISQYHLRPAQAEDALFLFDAYAQTQTEEMASVRWIDEQKQAFLQMQFDAQTKHHPTAGYYFIQQANHQGIESLILNDLMNRARQDNVD